MHIHGGMNFSSMFSQCHEVASAQVPGCYLNAGRGYRPDSARIRSPGQSPLSFSHSRRPQPGHSKTSPLQPSQDPARPPADQAAPAADGASAVGQAPGRPDQGNTASDSGGQAILEHAHKDASSNGLQHREGFDMSGLSLQDTRSESAWQSEQLLDEALSSTGDSTAEVQHMSDQHSGLHAAGRQSRPEDAEEALAAAQLSSEPVALEACSTGAEHAAAAGFEADLAASSAPAEPELVAVAERAEHAAAAVAAEGLELDRSSEPAAMAAARLDSLAPGKSSHGGRLS